MLRDPTGEFLQVVEQVSGGSRPRSISGVWASEDGKRALLLVRTRAEGSDIDAQQAAIATIRAAFAKAQAQLSAAGRGATLVQSGPAVFAVNSRGTIEHEAKLLSAISAVLIVALLLIAYRSPAAVLLGFVPVASGALAGVAAVVLGFGAVHGITLGFGITLIGEAVDYSIYLFVQKRARRRACGSTHAASACSPRSAGFAALLPSGFPGLAQLGLYSIAGLLAAALVTRYVLPHWLPARFAVRDLRRWASAAARSSPAHCAIALVASAVAGERTRCAAVLHRGSLWSRELRGAEPDPAGANSDARRRLRADLGAPDVRYIVVVAGADREAALRGAERVSAPAAARLIDDGVIGGFEIPTRFLPSLATQSARRSAMPPPAMLRERLARRSTDCRWMAKRLAAFPARRRSARAAPLLTRADLRRHVASRRPRRAAA